jgi:hypothetical protein
MSDWLNDVIGENLIAEYEGHYFTEDAVVWLRQKPRTIGELRSEEIDWLRWMAATTITGMYLKSCPTILISMSACG